jgi:hypothetical protein
MRRDIHNKNERIAALEAQLHQQHLASEAQARINQNKFEARLASQQLREQETESRLRDQVDTLTVHLKVRVTMLATLQHPGAMTLCNAA